MPNELFREPEIPIGWGALVESDGELVLARKPTWHEMDERNQVALLHRIARAGTRIANRTLNISFEEVSPSYTRV